MDINVGDVPGRPTGVMTTLNAGSTHTVVTWAQPTNTCGWPITGCTVAIQQTRTQFLDGRNQGVVSFNDATFNCGEVIALADNVNNNMNVQRYVLGNQCTLPLTTLEAAPYGIVDGESIYARIQCQNVLGMSLVSEINNGAINPSVPDAPMTLTCAAIGAASVTVNWQPGLSDGGAPLLCYYITVQRETFGNVNNFETQTYQYCNAEFDQRSIFNSR